MATPIHGDKIFARASASASRASSMAASILNSVLLPAIPFPKIANNNRIRVLSSFPFHSIRSNGFISPSQCSRIHAATDAPSSAAAVDAQQSDEEAVSIDNLHRFFHVNYGKWNGSFFQFDARGNLLHEINTKLNVSSYGEDELISMIQTLYIKQPTSSTSISGSVDEPEWAEYKIKETNMFTADKYQQLGFFSDEKAFALRYQTAGMLETVLRQGVLGEDDTGEESPKNIKLPSRRPSIVCESCLYFLEKDLRARAFHIMDPKGIIEMILLFLEEKNETAIFPLLDYKMGSTNRILPFLGSWRGHSITKRSGVYGATIAEADTVATLEIDSEGQIIQDITSTSISGVTTTVHWTGTQSDNLITFDGGYQLTLLPGGMMAGYPSDVSKSVAESKSFHLEFCWLQGPDKRQRLVRTYDAEGLAVSTTYFSEMKM